MYEKPLFFICNIIGKYPAFLGFFVWIENPVKCNACADNQNIGALMV